MKEFVVGKCKGRDVVLRVYELVLTDPPTVIEEDGGSDLGAFIETWLRSRDVLKIEILPEYRIVQVTYLR